jgi:DNA polymerase-3 subunit gamma/tau
MGEVATKVSLSALILSNRAFGRAAGETRSSWQPALALELAFLESVEALQPSRPVGPPSTVKAKAAPAESSPAARSEPRGARGGQISSTPAPAASVGVPGIQDVLGRWQEILKAAYASDPKTQALLNSSRPLGMEGTSLVLGFQSDLLREKMEKGNNLSVVQGALQIVLGAPVRLRCVLIQKWTGSAPSPEETPPMEEEGMVATALRDLGAHVIEIKTIPPENAA